MIDPFISLLYSLCGVLLGSIISWVPALHIYNLIAIFILLSAGSTFPIPLEHIPFLIGGLIVSYSFINTISAIYLSTNDDTTLFLLLPAQKYLLAGKAHEAVLLTGFGSLGGVFLILITSLLLPYILPPLRVLLTPHFPWIIGAIIVFMLLSEWPRTTDRAKTAIGRLKEAWSTLFFGILVFFLSGTLGFFVLNKPVIPIESAFQSLMPLFIGFFATPWILLNVFSTPKLPPQDTSWTLNTTFTRGMRGVFAGFGGGAFAAFFPVVTGGIGAFLAGHTTAQRGDDVFLIAQGANKVLYYTGGFLLFFVPFLHLRRGGAAWMMNVLVRPESLYEFYLLLVVIAIGGVISFFILIYLSKFFAKFITKLHYKLLSLLILIVIIFLVYFITKIPGLIIMSIATGIGLMAVLFGTRRLNCLGGILVPIFLNMSGLSEGFARLLGF